MESKMATAIIYDRYEILNESVNQRNPKTRFLERRVYHPVSRWDYERVMSIFKEKPLEYKLVGCDYGFCWAK